MEAKTRKEMLEELLERVCRVKTLNVKLIDELLMQFQQITSTKGDEESSLLLIVQLARKQLKRIGKIKDEKERSGQLRRMLFDVTDDITNHIRIFFKSPPNSDQASFMFAGP